MKSQLILLNLKNHIQKYYFAQNEPTGGIIRNLQTFLLKNIEQELIIRKLPRRTVPELLVLPKGTHFYVFDSGIRKAYFTEFIVKKEKKLLLT